MSRVFSVALFFVAISIAGCDPVELESDPQAVPEAVSQTGSLNTEAIASLQESLYADSDFEILIEIMIAKYMTSTRNPDHEATSERLRKKKHTEWTDADLALGKSILGFDAYESDDVAMHYARKVIDRYPMLSRKDSHTFLKPILSEYLSEKDELVQPLLAAAQNGEYFLAPNVPDNTDCDICDTAFYLCAVEAYLVYSLGVFACSAATGGVGFPFCIAAALALEVTMLLQCDNQFAMCLLDYCPLG